jgi:hypothetical protein
VGRADSFIVCPPRLCAVAGLLPQLPRGRRIYALRVLPLLCTTTHGSAEDDHSCGRRGRRRRRRWRLERGDAALSASCLQCGLRRAARTRRSRATWQARAVEVSASVLGAVESGPSRMLHSRGGTGATALRFPLPARWAAHTQRSASAGRTTRTLFRLAVYRGEKSSLIIIVRAPDQPHARAGRRSARRESSPLLARPSSATLGPGVNLLGCISVRVIARCSSRAPGV